MSTASSNNNFYELSAKSNVPIGIVELLFSNNSIPDTDALKFLNAVYSIKEKGITYNDKAILFGSNMFERVKKVFELLNTVDTSLDNNNLPFISGTIAAALGRYWWN